MKSAEITVTEGLTVLLAMNDATVGHAFASILEANDLQAATADSYADALALAGCDVVVAEFGGPAGALDGLELVERIRAAGLDPYIVLVGVDPSHDDYRRAVRLGVHDLLERPLLPEQLVAAIEAAAGNLDQKEGASSAGEGATLELILAAHPRAGEAAARDLISWAVRCDITPAARARIGSTVAELIENSVEAGATTIEVEATMTARELEVEIRDDGPGFDTAAVLAEAAIGSDTGLGRAQSLCEEMQIASELGAGTAIRVRFGVSVLEFDDPHRIDLSDLDFLAPGTSKELLATLQEDPNAPVVLSPALAVVAGRLLVGPDPRRTLQAALWS